eukprot:1146914-Pelagomonas_calceolata.AAC.32
MHKILQGSVLLAYTWVLMANQVDDPWASQIDLCTLSNFSIAAARRLSCATGCCLRCEKGRAALTCPRAGQHAAVRLRTCYQCSSTVPEPANNLWAIRDRAEDRLGVFQAATSPFSGAQYLRVCGGERVGPVIRPGRASGGLSGLHHRTQCAMPRT